MGTTVSAVTLLMALSGSSPIEDLASDHVDLIEINHYHDELGRPVFDQLIFYDWSASQGRYQVRAFRMLKSPLQMPRRNWANGGYDAVWHDGQNGDLLRRVHAQSIRESWTQFDPELVEREHLPKDRRQDLKKVSPGSAGSQVRAKTAPLAPVVVSGPARPRDR